MTVFIQRDHRHDWTKLIQLHVEQKLQQPWSYCMTLSIVLISSNVTELMLFAAFV